MGEILRLASPDQGVEFMSSDQLNDQRTLLTISALMTEELPGVG